MAEYDLFVAYDFGLVVRVRGTQVHLDFDFARPEFYGEDIDEIEDEALWNAREHHDRLYFGGLADESGAPPSSL